MPTDYAIKDGRTVFDATTYSGDSINNRTVNNVLGFKPDLVWAKSRSFAGQANQLVDSVRGTGTGVMKTMFSEQTTAEESTTSAATLSYGGIGSITSTGFTTVAGTNGTYPYAQTNQSGQTYVAWQWQAGQGTTSSNTSGTITSAVSANTTAGFSIVTYTGTGTTGTVGHGLGVAPKFYIVKSRSNASTNWAAYHSSLGGGIQLLLNGTNASITDSTPWNNTAPTSSVFSLGTNASTNPSGGTMVAYCWAEVAGFSKFGSYTGNGNADGPFVYTGFRPKFVMVKRTDSTASWMMYDTARNTKNVVNQVLYANLSNAEGTSDEIDILSNGFKMRTTGGSFNTSGGNYIYMAFAENPFKYSNAR